MRRATASKTGLQIDPIRVRNQLLRVAHAAAELHVPDESWVGNMDETGVLLVTASPTTYDVTGKKAVPVVGRSQRQQVTVVETLIMDGTVLDSQIIWGGTTDNVHPREEFKGLHYAHSSSHWCDSTTIMLWFDAVLLPYVTKLREQPQREHQAFLLLLDAYSAHWTDSFLDHAARHRVRCVPIEPGLTSVLQPCDHVCGTNRNIKPVLYRLMDSDYLDFVVQSMKQKDQRSAAVATALEKFNSKIYNVKLCDADGSSNIVQ